MLPLGAIILGLLLISGWTGCERVTSSLNPSSSLSPDELPKRGTTVLPKIGNSSPEVRVVPQGENRGKSGSALAGTAPQLNLDRAELRAYIESVADIHNERYISLFVVADSSGGFYHYAYETLNFYPIEEELSKGERELFIFVRSNQNEDGVRRMNIALVPKSATAFRDYTQWLLPNREESTSENNSMHRTAMGIQMDYYMQCDWVTEIVIKESASGDYYHEEIVNIQVGCVVYDIVDTIDDDLTGGGICWSCEFPGGGGSSNPSTGCDGDPNAVIDDCGRCVGGNTGRDPATDGMDCDKICDYDNSFLNRMDVQAEIHRMWNASFGPNSSPLPHDQRNEAVVFLEYYWEEGESFRVIEPESVSSCHIHIGNPFDGNNRRDAVRAILHTHPFSPGDAVWDQRCVDYHNSRLRPGQEPWQLGRIRYNAIGISEGDENIVRQLGKPMYVIDREGIRRINPENPSVYERHFDHCWN